MAGRVETCKPGREAYRRGGSRRGSLFSDRAATAKAHVAYDIAGPRLQVYIWGMNIVLKRIYDEPGHNDGTRVLVDRVWPRGMRKEEAHLDAWVKDVAPSTELRKWYGHDPERFKEFASRYRQELDSEDGRAALQELRDAVTGKRLTLLTATKDVEHSQAAVLAEILGD